jgi:hypothetical protein
MTCWQGIQGGQEQVWASSPALQAALRGRAAAAAVRFGELDRNYDGRPDAIHFKATVAAGGGPIHSVKLLLQFNYTLQVRDQPRRATSPASKQSRPPARVNTPSSRAEHLARHSDGAGVHRSLLAAGGRGVQHRRPGAFAE